MVYETSDDLTTRQVISLDMKDLKDHGAFKSNGAAGRFQWTWPTGETVASFEYETIISEKAGSLRLKYALSGDKSEPKRMDYSTSLERVPMRYGGARWWCKCPICGRRARILYLAARHNHFACRDCQQVRYECHVRRPSQGPLCILLALDRLEKQEHRLSKLRSPRKKAALEDRLKRRYKVLEEKHSARGEKRISWSK